MSPRLPHPCNWPGCPRVVAQARFCSEHLQQYRRQQDERRPPSSQRGYGGDWPAIRAAQLKREPFCTCGDPASEVDHVVPLTDGGTNNPSNLRSRCKRHHSAKTMVQSVDHRRRRLDVPYETPPMKDAKPGEILDMDGANNEMKQKLCGIDLEHVLLAEQQISEGRYTDLESVLRELEGAPFRRT